LFSSSHHVTVLKDNIPHYAGENSFAQLLFTQTILHSLSFSLFVLHTLEAKKLASFIISLLGIIVTLLPQPWVIGICVHPASACHRTTAITICLGIILVLVSIIQLFLLSKQKTSQVEG
jgi:hypothetical protein